MFYPTLLLIWRGARVKKYIYKRSTVQGLKSIDGKRRVCNVAVYLRVCTVVAEVLLFLAVLVGRPR